MNKKRISDYLFHFSKENISLEEIITPFYLCSPRSYQMRYEYVENKIYPQKVRVNKYKISNLSNFFAEVYIHGNHADYKRGSHGIIKIQGYIKYLYEKYPWIFTIADEIILKF